MCKEWTITVQVQNLEEHLEQPIQELMLHLETIQIDICCEGSSWTIEERSQLHGVWSADAEVG